MPPAIVTLAIAAFLSGAVIAAFVMLVAGIRAGDRPRHLTGAPDSQLDALTRTMLGVGVRTGPNAMGFRHLGVGASFPVLVTLGSFWVRAC